MLADRLVVYTSSAIPLDGAYIALSLILVFIINRTQGAYDRSMVDSTKVIRQLFDEIEIFIPGDSPSIFLSLDKM